MYTSLHSVGEGYYTERKSEFFSFAAPVSSEESAKNFINEVKRSRPGATHYVFAYHLRGGVSRFTDDGEPSGTSGKPTLAVLEKSEITDAVVVTARFYGGIMLGAGGLVRAYSMSAAEAARAAGRRIFTHHAVFILRFDYARQKKIEAALQKFDAVNLGATYGEAVTLKVAVKRELSGDFAAAATDSADGKIEIEKTSDGIFL